MESKTIVQKPNIIVVAEHSEKSCYMEKIRPLLSDLKYSSEVSARLYHFLGFELPRLASKMFSPR
jgi:hypothetical protein